MTIDKNIISFTRRTSERAACIEAVSQVRLKLLAMPHSPWGFLMEIFLEQIVQMKINFNWELSRSDGAFKKLDTGVITGSLCLSIADSDDWRSYVVQGGSLFESIRFDVDNARLKPQLTQVALDSMSVLSTNSLSWIKPMFELLKNGDSPPAIIFCEVVDGLELITLHFFDGTFSRLIYSGSVLHLDDLPDFEPHRLKATMTHIQETYSE